ncbi:MAG: hypothetical protein QOI21_3205 [Actinomycetota bacterium]|nr:hypothetical protein [Actinomycetota bacterium]
MKLYQIINGVRVHYLHNKNAGAWDGFKIKSVGDPED